MAYKIEGSTSHDCTIRVLDPTTGELVTSSNITAGDYSINVPDAGPYDIVARHSSGELVGFSSIASAIVNISFNLKIDSTSALRINANGDRLTTH